jgi:hypothetical protein
MLHLWLFIQVAWILWPISSFVSGLELFIGPSDPHSHSVRNPYLLTVIVNSGRLFCRTLYCGLPGPRGAPLEVWFTRCCIFSSAAALFSVLLQLSVIDNLVHADFPLPG